MATIAIYSLKGGVGKSTLAVNLAWCAATLSSRRTLLWDLDPQAASSWMLGEDGGGERAHAVFSRHISPSRLIRVTTTERLDLLPADASLRDLNHLFRALAKKRRLARLLGELGDHDRVVLDCPPGLTETADQVARAADLIVVPVVPSALSERAWEEVDRHLGGRTRTMPVHVMVDRRRALHAEALTRHPDWPVIPMASVVESAATRRRPVGHVAPRSPAALAVADLWKRIEKRLA
ncbi:Cellulose biosynthesis protein BcsQ [Sphingomonas palmae]|uniref:Cellulose biosynthesis protein BcsQ n=1 Tax=Sphingomonas palmae TaxID=1855283 RepID=A0A1H7Q4G4_9SPHN|nr:ParA family protein [Sphingomonas palmae]SEL42893.1 Cellulose biosynthesis protein BcsQ [Sphingomonas palmae]